MTTLIIMVNNIYSCKMSSNTYTLSADYKECACKYRVQLKLLKHHSLVVSAKREAVAIMDLNITGVDNQLHYDVNVALNVCFFIFLSLLPVLLCVLVILALVLAKTINIKIRVLLINIFAAEILGWIVYAIFHLGWIVRLNHNETISCKLFYATFLVANIQKLTSGTFYIRYQCLHFHKVWREEAKMVHNHSLYCIIMAYYNNNISTVNNNLTT